MFKFFFSLQRAFVAFVINCQIDGVSLGGWENFEQSKVVRICLMANSHIKEFLLPSPYNPRPFQTLLGEYPETPVVVDDTLFHILYYKVAGVLRGLHPLSRCFLFFRVVGGVFFLLSKKRKKIPLHKAPSNRQFIKCSTPAHLAKREKKKQ